MSLISRLLLAFGALFVGGCYDQGDGVEPPLKKIYFPTAIALSAGATRMYVVNSDFDLQFNGGSLQSFDLARIRTLIPKECSSDADCGAEQRCDLEPTEENGGFESHWCVATSGEFAGKPCGPFGEKSFASKLLQPGRCDYIHTTQPQDGGPSLVLGEVGVGAFATDLLYRPRPNGPGGRLFVPVRGDATLHFIDTVDETDGDVGYELECGQSGNGGDCDDSHRKGDDPDEENTRDIRLPAEPFGVAATADGAGVVITHQTEGAASLFFNDDDAWGDGAASLGVGPKLEFAVGGLSSRPIGVAAVPEPAFVDEHNAIAADADKIRYEPGFLVTFRDSPEVDLLRFFADEGGNPQRPFLQLAGSVPITVNSLGFDSRGIAIDGSDRRACESACPAPGDATRLDCLKACAGVPLGVYVANRTPSTLLIGETRPNQSLTSSDDMPRFYHAEPLPFGPSRVMVGEVINKNGEAETRIFVLCFDSRKMGIFDPKGGLHSSMNWIETGRGPHGIALELGRDAAGNPAHAYAYIGHFTDSYIGVVDLDMRHRTFGTTLATVGRATPPRASK